MGDCQFDVPAIATDFEIVFVNVENRIVLGGDILPDCYVDNGFYGVVRNCQNRLPGFLCRVFLDFDRD